MFSGTIEKRRTVTIRRTLLFLMLCSPCARRGSHHGAVCSQGWLGKDGAPANINAITQTTDGYLWLASTQGLYRFDGVQFERFGCRASQWHRRPLYTLLSSPNGDLWVGSAVSGISLLRNGTNRNYTGANGFPEGAVLGLAQDHHGSIWAATQGGLARFDGAKWQKLGPEWGFEGTPISLYVDRNATLWAGTLRTSSSIFQQAPPGFTGREIRSPPSCNCSESPSGTLWMAESRRAVRPMPPAKGPDIGLGSRQILFDRDGSSLDCDQWPWVAPCFRTPARRILKIS